MLSIKLKSENTQSLIPPFHRAVKRQRLAKHNIEEREREVKNRTSVHEVPGNGEDGADKNDAGHDVLLVAAVQVVLHPRPKALSCRCATAFGVAAHVALFVIVLQNLSFGLKASTVSSNVVVWLPGHFLTTCKTLGLATFFFSLLLALSSLCIIHLHF